MSGGFFDGYVESSEKRVDLPDRYFNENLERALAEDWIRVHYMPIVRASNGRVCHEEALARWIDPDKGMILPDGFIPALEKTRQIYRLDLYVLDSVLEKIRIQMNAGLYVVPISVNLSRIDFEVCDIVDEVCRRVDGSGISRDRIIIELTEDVIGENFDYLKEQIERFQQEGFSVWMDDFGSGYSSLNILQDINFDHIKLDMRFLKRFDRDRSRIIVKELVRMAMALGIKTVAEGVETAEHVEFLREIGCNEMQGYYFCRPLSLEELLRRYEEGRQIGFENPEERDYYDAIGTINLYDMSVIVREDAESKSIRQYFDMLPIAVYETDESGFTLVRGNQAYMQFEKQFFEAVEAGHRFAYEDYVGKVGEKYANSVSHCARTGDKVFFDENLDNAHKMHAVVSRIAENPVTGRVACATVILDVVEPDKDSAVDFAQVAKALSTDYLYLYYVNVRTDEYVEYENFTKKFNINKNGRDFFGVSREKAMNVVVPDELDMFMQVFTKENVLKALKEHGAFTHSYRLIRDGEPIYVSMKAVMMGKDGDHMIIGVNSINAQMKFQAEYNRVREEGKAYSRIMALVGDFIATYVVDPATGSFEEYSTTGEYDKLDLSKSGEDFFADAREKSMRVIYSEDRDLFNAMFTRDKVIREAERKGSFEMIYRLLLNDRPEYVSLRASLIEESDGRKLLVGIRKYT